MEDNVTYAVFWRSKYNPEWVSFTSWLVRSSDAEEVMSVVIKNPACIEAAIVERVETFDFVTKLEASP